MASLYRKVIGGKPYWYLREMAWVAGKPKMVSERYVGSAAEVGALLDAREAAVMPERTRHLGFGDVAAVWGMLERLGVIETIDEVAGARRSDAGASVGTYLALAALNRLVAPCSKLALQAWWRTTAADRFTRIPAGVLDHRKFWEAMHAVTTEQLVAIEHRLALRMIDVFGLDISALALDMTNFATYIDSTNDKAPLAQRGKAKQKRADLRLVGLGLVVTRDGGVPLVSHAYPGNRPDVTQFGAMIDLLTGRYTAVATAASPDSDADADTATATPAAEMTVVFDAGQNSVANFAHLDAAGLGFVGSVPPSDCPDLLALPATDRHLVDEQRFAGVSALQTRREVYGAERRVVLTHSPTLHTAQSRGFDQTLATATAKLTALADTLARGHTRRPRPQVEAEIATITKDPWVSRVLTYQLTGNTPPEYRLSFHLDAHAQQALEQEIFGKRVLITNRQDWPVAEVVAGYRSQSEAKFGFRQLKDPHLVSFSPMHHWTDHNIRVHLFTCVLALQIAHLIRRHAHQHGLALSVRELLDTLAGIEETVLIYPSTGGRPKARRMLTETTPTQDRLTEIFDLTHWAPRT
ncbi:MAG: IS1634 family transposase [Actinobacteria bacterium]|nr:IS1634 family transposase [Actinomycetota bacterium]MCA1681983.1 IS1634 family transposase [Actinomycetota bacterium]